jgi:hypothetical protein
MRRDPKELTRNICMIWSTVRVMFGRSWGRRGANKGGCLDIRESPTRIKTFKSLNNVWVHLDYSSSLLWARITRLPYKQSSSVLVEDRMIFHLNSSVYFVVIS